MQIFQMISYNNAMHSDQYDNDLRILAMRILVSSVFSLLKNQGSIDEDMREKTEAKAEELIADLKSVYKNPAAPEVLQNEARCLAEFQHTINSCSPFKTYKFTM